MSTVGQYERDMSVDTLGTYLRKKDLLTSETTSTTQSEYAAILAWCEKLIQEIEDGCTLKDWSVEELQMLILSINNDPIYWNSYSYAKRNEWKPLFIDNRDTTMSTISKLRNTIREVLAKREISTQDSGPDQAYFRVEDLVAVHHKS